MNNEVATLQNIANTLEQEPLASQRVLAENAGMSIGLMNAVLKRFVERGWIMLTNVHLRKLSDARRCSRTPHSRYPPHTT